MTGNLVCAAVSACIALYLLWKYRRRRERIWPLMLALGFIFLIEDIWRLGSHQPQFVGLAIVTSGMIALLLVDEGKMR